MALKATTLLFKILNSGDYLNKADGQALADKNSSQLVPSISDKGLRYDLNRSFCTIRRSKSTQHHLPIQTVSNSNPVWRADRPQKGRYREFWQCDADVIGTKSLVCEADFIQIYHQVFTNLGLKDYQVRLNHRKILEAIAKTIEFKGSFTDLTVAIDKLDKIGWDGVTKELSEKGLAPNKIDHLKALLHIKPFSVETIDELQASLVDCEEKVNWH